MLKSKEKTEKELKLFKMQTKTFIHNKIKYFPFKIIGDSILDLIKSLFLKNKKTDLYINIS